MSDQQHTGEPRGTRTIDVREAVLGKNTRLAQDLRSRWEREGVLAVNMLSSPGSGKTALLERTLGDLQGRVRAGVIVGDLETDNDARRLRGRGAPVVQVVTGGVCHLEAGMVSRALDEMAGEPLDLLIVENVGNLVCPASYDLGERLRVALLSVTEGEDKPLKYPVLFHSAHVAIVTKIDIAEAVGFRRDEALANIRRAAPAARILELSARTGVGMQAWYDLLDEHLAAVRNSRKDGKQ